MKQESTQKFISEDHKIVLFCDNDTALGSLHDFLMAAKGMIVDRMVAAQKAEAEAAQKQKEAE
jgi:hypothetical protein